MAYRTGYNPAQGAITPEKYTSQGLPSPGPAYYRRGEQPGYVYDPYADKYRPDPKTQGSYYQDAGLVDKPEKKPGMMESIVAPAAVTAGTYALGQAGSHYLTRDAAKDVGKTVAQDMATTAAQAPAAQTGAGMIGSEAGSTAANAAATGAPATPTIVGAEYVAPQSEAAAAGTLGYAGAAAGAAAGAYGVHQMHSQGSYQSSPGEQGLQGAAAGAALGASAGSVVPGVGTVIGGAIGAVVGGLYGLGRGAFGDGNKWKTEKRKVERLNDAGVYVPPNILEAAQKQKPRSLGMIQKETSEQLQSQGLPEDYVGFDNNGQWVNAQFAKTRDEKDLRPEDIVNFSAFAEHDTSWFMRPLQERLNVAKAALDAGAVAEGKGSLAVGFDKFDYDGALKTQYAAASGNPTLQREQSGATASASNAAKGTRLSPGIYADGKGGTYRK